MIVLNRFVLKAKEMSLEIIYWQEVVKDHQLGVEESVTSNMR